MKKQQYQRSANISDVPFAERGFTVRQTLLILSVGKTKFFTDILPQLKHYLDGNRIKITGRSIQAYRKRRLAEPRQRRSLEHLHKAKAQIESQREGDAAL